MLLSQINDLPRIEMLAPGELPERWIDFSQYDIAAISMSDLQSMAEKQPKQLAALRDWVSTGPLLVIYGVGEKFEQLAAIEKRLALVPLAADSNRPAGPGNWTVPDRKFNRADLLTPFSSDYGVNARKLSGLRSRKRVTVVREKDADVEPAADKDDKASKVSGPPPFVFRRAGTGCVVAIASDQPFPGKTKDWAWLLNAVPDSHWKWFRREGFSLHRANDDYWKCLIPGVGEAPVVSFLLLVSLFAVVIGPVNYVLLGRSRRLYLLLLTVPAGAAHRHAQPDRLRPGDRRPWRAAADAQLRRSRPANRAGRELVAAVVLRLDHALARAQVPGRYDRLSDLLRSRNRAATIGAAARWFGMKGRTCARAFSPRALRRSSCFSGPPPARPSLLVREGAAPGSRRASRISLGTTCAYLLAARPPRRLFRREATCRRRPPPTLTAIEPAAAERSWSSFAEAVELEHRREHCHTDSIATMP